MKVAQGQEEETVAQGLPGSLMYELYEELCSQDPVGFLGNYGPNMGTEKIRNLPTMYSEGEPGSRAGGASEGTLPVTHHHSPSACPQPWDPHSHSVSCKEHAAARG